jgi:hypothetical protein
VESSRRWFGALDEIETLFEYVDNKTQRPNGQSNRHPQAPSLQDYFCDAESLPSSGLETCGGALGACWY